MEVRELVGGIGKSSLCGDTTEGQHCKTAVQNLGKLHAVRIFLGLVLEERQRVKAEVTGFTVALALGNLNESSTCAELDEADSHQQECHGSLLNKNVVSLVRSRDILNRVDISRETHVDAESTIGGKPSEPGEHRNTGVLEFSLSHPVESRKARSILPRWGLDETGKVLWDTAQVEWVESNITNIGSVEVSWSWQERESSGSLGLVNHIVPHAVRHGTDFSTNIGRGRWDKGSGSRGHQGSNGKGKLSHGQIFERVN